MSNNSCLQIEWDGKWYEITHFDADSGMINKAFYTRTLTGAVKAAKELQEEFNPEYGVTFGELKPSPLTRLKDWLLDKLWGNPFIG